MLDPMHPALQTKSERHVGRFEMNMSENAASCICPQSLGERWIVKIAIRAFQIVLLLAMAQPPGNRDTSTRPYPVPARRAISEWTLSK